MQTIAAGMAGMLLSLSVQAAEPMPDYSFISGDDLYDALSQDSMVLQGYILGVADSLKHSSNPKECFTIPLSADADQLIYSGYLSYWKGNLPRPDNAVTAITQMMRSKFSCVGR